MTSNLLALVLTSTLILAPGRPAAATMQSATADPGAAPAQPVYKTLNFAVPEGWVKDEDAARKLGIYTVLLPRGMKLDKTDRSIKVSYEKKHPGKSGPEELKNFGRGVLNNTLAEFPEADFSKWQPSKMAPGKDDFYSIEIYGKEKNKPAPQRLLVLDAGDAYFTILLSVEKRKDLELPQYEDFFNSIRLGM